MTRQYCNPACTGKNLHLAVLLPLREKVPAGRMREKPKGLGVGGQADLRGEATDCEPLGIGDTRLRLELRRFGSNCFDSC